MLFSDVPDYGPLITGWVTLILCHSNADILGSCVLQCSTVQGIHKLSSPMHAHVVPGVLSKRYGLGSGQGRLLFH